MMLTGMAPVAAAVAPAPAELRGIRQASLLASQLTADGVACGLNLAPLDAAARAKLADEGLALAEQSPVRVTLSAMTSQVGASQAGTSQAGTSPAGAPGSCASAVLLGVYSRESFFSASAGWLRTGYVVLWQRGMMVAGPANEHAAAVAGAVRQLTEQMLAAWHAQNPPASRDAAALVTSAVTPDAPSPAGTGAPPGDFARPAPPN